MLPLTAAALLAASLVPIRTGNLSHLSVEANLTPSALSMSSSASKPRLVYICTACCRKFQTQRGCETHIGMSADCKGAHSITDTFTESGEVSFAEDALVQEYQHEMKARLLDSYGDMRYEKLIPGKHVDH
eukprot:3836947-Pleurochrysis_carterae.AAC.1